MEKMEYKYKESRKGRGIRHVRCVTANNECRLASPLAREFVGLGMSAKTLEMEELAGGNLNIASSGGGGGSGLTLTLRSLFVGSLGNKKNTLLPTSLVSVSYLYNFDFDGNLRKSEKDDES